MISEFEDGVLPEGLHDCTIDEIEDRFGYFGRTEQRSHLTEKLRQFVDEAQKAGFIAAVVVNGSYITTKDQPNDIDVIICLKPDTDMSREMRPFEYNVCSKRMVRKLYKFDAFVVIDGSEEHARAVEFFSQVRTTDPDLSTNRKQKGLLRIPL